MILLGLMVTTAKIRVNSEANNKLDNMCPQAYQGSAVRDFLTALPIYGQIYNSDPTLGRGISIVQSNGTGMSRFVEEMGNAVKFYAILTRPIAKLMSCRCRPSASVFETASPLLDGHPLMFQRTIFLNAWIANSTIRCERFFPLAIYLCL
jgi:hypothetical protein